MSMPGRDEQFLFNVTFITTSPKEGVEEGLPFCRICSWKVLRLEAI
jgi:hypothetical protein